MKRNVVYPIRFKMVLLFFFSIVLSVCTVSLLYIAAAILSDYSSMLRSILAALYNLFGIPIVTTLAGVVFFVFYVIVLSRGSVLYLLQITKAVQQLAKGKFEMEIPVKTRDELGDLADNINLMSRQLHQSITEERIAVQTKNELITNVSHDLRTPLTSVIGYLRLVEDDRYKDEVELRYYINVAYEKSRRLERLVNDLFEYTRMSYGGAKLAFTEINIVELLGQLTTEVSLQCRDENLDIRAKFGADKIVIMADGDKLMRVFENLVSNAIKYGKAGKKIEIEVGKEAGSAVIRIVNYGPPIPAVDLPHIFDRFYRVDKSRSDETGGTGLGLAIAKSIVELHHGSISVASDADRTVFEVRLPVANSASRGAKPAIPNPS
ncbi:MULTISPECIES: cell wall metabolism sensor histidine kinase WalK [unclassified Paenibacillus]|uniref:sensor histidine kinase n=1 Tax=unclassified Paenibacillus TaxID=185978 RepID=UPI001E494EBD|nr:MULTISPECIES: HAMP domain-containing sensor histidine kinase [unclassified Paenibacillus]CAH0118539.1 Adaptive-response sensory-kinase SasA [Paenibacillus sp. CECT 9249]